MNAQLVFFIGRKLAHFVKEFEAYSPVVGELDPETETRDAVIENPLFPDDPAEALYIEFGDELTVYWHGHRHFSTEDYWYDMMVEYVHDILSGRVFSAVLKDSGGKTVAVSTADSTKISYESAYAIFGETANGAHECYVYFWGKEPFAIPIQ